MLDRPASFSESNLYPWQQKAVAAWLAAGKRGIVEAVTASGKTHVGVGAIAALQSEEKRTNVLVVVHTVELMNQWHDRLSAAFPGRRVGLIGDGLKEDYSITPVACVGIINSVHRRLGELFAHHCRGDWRSLLIADECHHYVDAPVFGKLLRYEFDYTLGLSATIGQYEVEGLGRIVYEYKFTDAYRDGLVPPFDLVNVGVNLTPDERDEYLRVTDAIREQFKLVYDLYSDQLLFVPDYQLFRTLKQIMNRENVEDPIIKKLFILLFKRAAICYTAERKMGLAQRFTRLLVDRGRKKTIVFFERIDSAEEAKQDVSVACASRLRNDLLKGDPIWCRVYHSQLKRDERADVLAQFKEIGPSALLACRSLDEGVDIPTVDAAILAASTQSKRQRIQRIGRTLRRGSGEKRPLIISLYVHGTSDENVCAEDMEAFKGVASIYNESESSCVRRVESLLDGDSKLTQTIETAKYDPSLDSRKWHMIAEGVPVSLSSVMKLVNRFKGQAVRVHLANGVMEVGKLELCMVFEMRLSDGRSIKEPIARIEVCCE